MGVMGFFSTQRYSGVPEESLSEVKGHLAPKNFVPQENSETRYVWTMPRQVNNLRPTQQQNCYNHSKILFPTTNDVLPFLQCSVPRYPKILISDPDPQIENQEFRIRILDPDPSVN